MNRSPLFYPLNRGGDAEIGGAADLQTDVMRFMAILSLCLVAIFALVQSIPLTPNNEATSSIELITAPAEEALQNEVEESMQVDSMEPSAATLTRPKLERTDISKDKVVLNRPKPAAIATQEPQPVAAKIAQLPPATTKNNKPPEEGFTLSFETDAALTRLVEQRVVGLYAITPNQSLRMSIDDEKVSFWPASTPNQFHEMDIATVPDIVKTTYQRGNTPTVAKWGVTLPAGMSRELSGMLESETGGSIVIAANGNILLRR